MGLPGLGLNTHDSDNHLGYSNPVFWEDVFNDHHVLEILEGVLWTDLSTRVLYMAMLTCRSAGSTVIDMFHQDIHVAVSKHIEYI